MKIIDIAEAARLGVVSISSDVHRVKEKPIFESMSVSLDDGRHVWILQPNKCFQAGRIQNLTKGEKP